MLVRRLPPSQATIATALTPSVATKVDDTPPSLPDEYKELNEVLEASLTGYRHLLTPKQCAALLGVSPSTLQTWRALGKGPNFVKFSRRTVRYLPSSVTAWLHAAANR